MSARSPDLSNKPGTVPGRRDALTASPPPAGPATNSPTSGKLPLSATERTRHRRYRHLGRADRESLYAVLDAGLVAHLGVITGGWPMVVPTMYGFTADTLYLHGSVASQSLNTVGTVEVGAQTFTVLAYELAGAARAELWPKLVAEYPTVGEHQAKTTRQFPVFLLTRQD